MTLITHIRKQGGKQPLYLQAGYPESLHQIPQKMDVKLAIRTLYRKPAIAGSVRPPSCNAKAHKHQSQANARREPATSSSDLWDAANSTASIFEATPVPSRKQQGSFIMLLMERPQTWFGYQQQTGTKEIGSGPVRHTQTTPLLSCKPVLARRHSPDQICLCSHAAVSVPCSTQTPHSSGKREGSCNSICSAPSSPP